MQKKKNSIQHRLFGHEKETKAQTFTSFYIFPDMIKCIIKICTPIMMADIKISALQYCCKVNPLCYDSDWSGNCND
jgi:hypothetical protein